MFHHIRDGINTMDLVVLSGFLGSGKTTLLLQLARGLQARGQTVAIVVNEIGDIGIDNTLLRHLGGEVWELVGGCVCCTLAGSLAETLKEIAQKFAPDKVLLEPSGASQPDLVVQALACGGDLVHDTRWIAVVDPLRLTELVAVIEPLLESQLACADVVVIAKADSASPEQMDSARRWVGSLRPDLRCIALGRCAGDAVSAAQEELLSWL